MIQNETITLNNGVKIPKLALGVWMIPDEETEAAVKSAINLGYRHIDTAQAYGNEHGVGAAIRTCGIPREEIFVTSKIAAEHKTYESAIALIDYCKSLGIEMEAYSPVAHGVALRNEKIADMAKKYGVSTAQLCIRYDWQLGMIVLPKTANPVHQEKNRNIDFEISAEDMEILKKMDKIDSYEEFGGFPVYGGKYKG